MHKKTSIAVVYSAKKATCISHGEPFKFLQVRVITTGFKIVRGFDSRHLHQLTIQHNLPDLLFYQ